MKKSLFLLGLAFAIISCSSNAEFTDKIKQKVEKDAMGIDLNYKNITFQWLDTLTVQKQLAKGISQYNEGIAPVLNASSIFSENNLTKDKLIELRNWENEIREKPFRFMGKKYKNYVEFAFANRSASSFISELCDQIEKTDKLLTDWSNLGKGNLELITNAIWYYERKDTYNNSTPKSTWGQLTTLIKVLEEIQIENNRLSKMDANEVIEYKALNNYKINNPLLNGAEVDVKKYFIFDNQLNIIRTEVVQ
tara:strand:+ start:85 stop:834 length:750 start_codon:yes stop_codon:yes gene_type:complete